jgi:hypothetical protein
LSGWIRLKKPDQRSQLILKLEHSNISQHSQTGYRQSKQKIECALGNRHIAEQPIISSISKQFSSVDLIHTLLSMIIDHGNDSIIVFLLLTYQKDLRISN